MKNGLLIAVLFSGGTIFGIPGAFGQIARTIDPEKPVFTGRVHKVPQTENTNLLNLSRPPWPHLLSSVRRVPLQYSTIQAAIDASSNGDTVLVSDGTYYENIFFRGKKIVVASTFLTTSDTSHISQTVIDGGGAIIGDSASVVYFISGEDTNSVLCGFTVRGGKGTSATGYMGGGGVYCTSGARLVRNIITQNSLSGGQLWGGGVDAENGQTLIMEQNIVSGNTLSGTWGGGAGVEVYNMKAIIRNNTIIDNTVNTQGTMSGSHCGGINCESGTFSLVGNLIARNRALAPTATQYASYGGGFLVRAGDLEFRNNRVVDNLIQTSTSVTAYGGGICLLAADSTELRQMTLSGNYIGGNTALGGSNTIGGGIGIRNEKPRIENNIIENNTTVNGGGIGIEGSLSTPPAVLVNNTICDNNATVGGGALLRAGAIVVAFNNIFWADTAQSHAEISVLGSSSRADVLNCDVQGGYAGTGNIDSDPKFVVGDSVFNLTKFSPCIGRGVDSLYVNGIWYRAPTSDFGGHPRPRPAGSQPSDIGAQEEQVTTDVPDGRQAIPTRFALEQNYPNPFNPTTGIRYQVAGVSEVKLVVYDLLGREVAVLVNERKAPGSYEVEFDAAGLASGVYLYRLTAGSFVQTREMLVIK